MLKNNLNLLSQRNRLLFAHSFVIPTSMWRQLLGARIGAIRQIMNMRANEWQAPCKRSKNAAYKH